MILYLDTSVILARWAPGEPSHLEAKAVLQAVEEGKAEAVTSALTLLEIVSATSRALERFREGEEPMSREAVSGALLRRVVNTRSLSMVPFGGDVSLGVGERGVTVPALLAVALEAASKTGVKALDSLHVASVAVASRIYGRSVDYLVTLDEDMLKRRSEIEGLVGARVAAPGELLPSLQ